MLLGRRCILRPHFAHTTRLASGFCTLLSPRTGRLSFSLIIFCASSKVSCVIIASCKPSHNKKSVVRQRSFTTSPLTIFFFAGRQFQRTLPIYTGFMSISLILGDVQGPFVYGLICILLSSLAIKLTPKCTRLPLGCNLPIVYHSNIILTMSACSFIGSKV